VKTSSRYDQDYATYKVIKNSNGDTFSLFQRGDNGEWLKMTKHNTSFINIQEIFISLYESGIKYALTDALGKIDKVRKKISIISIDDRYHTTVY
jgi:hypothetical protein